MLPPEMKKKAKHLLFLAQSVVNNELNLYANSRWGEKKKDYIQESGRVFLISVFPKSHILAKIKIGALFVCNAETHQWQIDWREK